MVTAWRDKRTKEGINSREAWEVAQTRLAELWDKEGEEERKVREGTSISVWGNGETIWGLPKREGLRWPGAGSVENHMDPVFHILALRLWAQPYKYDQHAKGCHPWGEDWKLPRRFTLMLSSVPWWRVKLYMDGLSLACFPERTGTPSYTCCFHLKGWKSTKTEISLKCSYMARGRWKDVVFHSRGMHSVLMQKHCMRGVPHIMQDGVTLGQCHLEVGCSSSNHRKAGELKGGEKNISFPFPYSF